MTARSLYPRILGTYFAWARLLLPLAALVFVPLSLLDTITISADLDALDPGEGLLAAAALAAVLALIGTTLLGEVFYSGAVAIALTHDAGAGAPSLRSVARQIAYRRLIAVDLIFAAIVLAGVALFLVPGLLLFFWLALAGPVVEIERRGVRAAFVRSRELVRGRFWLVVAVLAPLELLSEAVAALAGKLAEALLGHGFAAEWMAEAVADIAFVPLVAVATVLLTVGLIAEKDRRSPRLHSAPPEP